MIEKWSIGYEFLRPYFNFAFWLFHREITLSGRKSIPQDKPVIFAPNHPNALHDDLAIVYSAPQQVVWLGRADLFRSRIARPFLRFLKIIPVYRIRDGKESLGGNDVTFRTAVKVLQNNKAIAIYPEAENSHFRSMVPHKKAIARIAFLGGELSEYTLDTRIVPTGIFFDQNHNFGRRMVVIYGSPIAVRDYYTLYRENPQKASISLRNDLEEAIRKLILDYRTPENAKGYEAARKICTGELLRKRGAGNNLHNRFELARELAARLDLMEKETPEKAAGLVRTSLELEKRLFALGLRHWLVNKAEEKPGKVILNGLYLLLTFPVFFIGLLFNAIPWFVIDNLVRKKVKNEIFKSTFSFGIGFLLFPLVYLLEMALLILFLVPWYLGIVLLVFFPLTGKFAHNWHILFLKTRGRVRWLNIKRRKPELYQSIHQGKQDILAILSQ